MSDIPVIDFAPSSDIPEMKFGDTHVQNAPGGGRTKPDPFTSEALTASNKKDLVKDLGFENYSVGKFLKSMGSEFLEVGDLVASIPSQLIGVGAGMTASARKVGQGAGHRQSSQAALDAQAEVNNAFGQPLHKLAALAGVGKTEGQETVIGGAMNRLSSLLSKGGEWVEKNTHGAVMKQDVKLIVNTAMAAAGGRGLEAGLKKVVPQGMQLEGVRMSPERARAMQNERLQAMDPKDAAKVPEGKAAEAATVAATGKTKGVEAKNLKFDPLTGELSEAIPEMGKELPKASTLDVALEKMQSGRAFDMTAEERIAYKGWKDEPLPQPLVDEQGKLLSTTVPGKPPQETAPSTFNNEKFLQDSGFASTGPGSDEWVMPVSKLGDVIAKPIGPGRMEISADYMGKRLGTRTAEGSAAVKEAIEQAKTGIQAGREKLAANYRAEESGLGTERTKKLGSQSGSVDPKLLARMSAIGLGAWAGQYFSDDHDLLHAVMGGAAAALLTSGSPRSAASTFKKMFSEDTRLNVKEIADAHEKYTTLAANDVWMLQKDIEELVPKVEDRNAITHAIESGDLSKLTPAQVKAAGIAKKYFDEIGSVASLEGVLKSAKDDYVTHLWDWSQNDKSLVQKWLDKSSGGQGMGTGNKFAKERTYDTIADGKAAGLKPLTEDISHIMGIYGNSMSRSIANSVFTRALKNEKVPGTEQSLVMTADKAPHSYVSINNASMQGLHVHPDIAPSLKMLYDTSQPGAAMKIMQGLSDTSKRVAVSFSLFHAKALTDAMIGGTQLSKIPGNVGRAWRGGFDPASNLYLRELRKGSASPLVERAAEGGLKFSLEHIGAGVEDAGQGFYGAMTSLQGTLDKIIPGAGLPVKGLVELNRKVDTFMWARLHAGMKLNVFADKYQQLIDNSTKAAAKGQGQALSPEQASRIAASYTNDLFGGLNWRRIAEDATTRFGREAGQATLNPGARRILQLVAFAPDWTISTTRAAVQAFGKPDFLAPKTLAGLHQQYLLRSAAYYLVVGDAINYSMSGHHLWQNKDPTTLDMNADGSLHMQWSKHTMEPVHWLTKPGQQALNKLGVLPREGLEQGLGVEYLSSKGRMPPMENRLTHLAKTLVPIAGQQANQGGFGRGVSGFLGAPVYGSTKEDKAKAKAERAAKKKKRPIP